MKIYGWIPQRVSWMLRSEKKSLKVLRSISGRMSAQPAPHVFLHISQAQINSTVLKALRCLALNSIFSFIWPNVETKASLHRQRWKESMSLPFPPPHPLKEKKQYPTSEEASALISMPTASQLRKDSEEKVKKSKNIFHLRRSLITWVTFGAGAGGGHN